MTTTLAPGISTRYEANFLGLESRFEILPMDEWLRVRWHLTKLGESFPGGDWLVQNPVLTFQAVGREPVCVSLLPGEASRATVAGLTAFRRMRGAAMPERPLTYAVGLSAGEYSVSFSAEIYDCRRLVLYCDALQFFAGDFADMVRAFEADAAYWASKFNAEAAEPFRFSADMELGDLTVTEDLLTPPYYQLSNEADLPHVEWQPAFRLKRAVSFGSELQPERYFESQLKSGIAFMREWNFCRYGTHCLDAPMPGGSAGTGARGFAMWGHSFTSHYILTGDAESGAAGQYAAGMVSAFLEQGPAPHHQHVLQMGSMAMMLTRYAIATDQPELTARCAQILRQWPYDWACHHMATEPAPDGGDVTPNDTYNMKMAGACGMWLLGKYLNDTELKARGRDCVLNFVLPAMQPEAFWYYRPGSPEGEIQGGIPQHNHYDGLLKSLLGRLLMHQEWRDEPGVLDTLQRGMDFLLDNLADDDARSLKWELHPGVAYGELETLARYLGHAGMFCEPLWVLAAYRDPKYLIPLQRTVQFTYDLRDHELLKNYWDNSWLYTLYEGLFTLSALGVQFSGTPRNLELNLGQAGQPLL